MLDREATKFTEEEDKIKIREFLEHLLQEVARDLAENQANTIPNESLGWIAEFVASGMFSPDFTSTVVHRAKSIAFLTPDTRSDYTRFTHEQISIHFLAQECFRSIVEGELPKYVRRNIFGLETLEGFARAAESLKIDQATEFVMACKNQMISHVYSDRSRQNLAALAVVVACVADISVEESLHFDNIDLGEILIPTDAAPIAFSNVIIRTLYVRSVDLQSIVWNNAKIITLFADNYTIVGDIPPPDVVELPEKTLRIFKDIHNWLHPEHLHAEEPAIPAGYLDLLRKIDRYRPFWLREDPDTADRSAQRIIRDPHWEVVRQVLLDHSLIVERDVQAAGPHANFIHFRHSGGQLVKNQEVISALQ